MKLNWAFMVGDPSPATEREVDRGGQRQQREQA
jgi:hypothetical protein